MEHKWLRICLLLFLVSSLPQIRCSQNESDEDWEELDDLDLEAAVDAGGSVSDVAVARARNVLVDLTDQTAQRVIAAHEHVLLLGYASWCTRSSALMPEFAAAASALAGSVLFAKLDATAHAKAASLYKIKGFPTILFFTNGSIQETYPGGDTKEEIVNWIRKRTGLAATTVSSIKDAEDLVRNLNVLVGGYFERFEGREYESFLEAAKREVGTEFVQTTDLEVAKVFNASIETSPSVWVQKSEAEFYVPFGGAFTAEEILEFVELNKYPLVVRLTSKTAAKINSSPLKLQVLLFAEEENVKDLLLIFQEVASKFKDKMMFVLIENSDLDLAMPFLSIYGVQPGKFLVGAFNYGNGRKYLLENDINNQNLMEFCKGLLSGELPQHYKSEPAPLKNKGNLQIVVGKTFEQVVLDDSKDVFLQITSPWCAMCEAANKTVEKLATVFKDVDSVVIAQIDASANEHPKLEVNNFPSFLFYPAGKKEKPISVPSKANLKSLVQFVKEHATTSFTIPSGQTNSSSRPITDSKQKISDKDEL